MFQDGITSDAMNITYDAETRTLRRLISPAAKNMFHQIVLFLKNYRKKTPGSVVMNSNGATYHEIDPMLLHTSLSNNRIS